MKFAQYYGMRLDGTLGWRLGSDSVRIMDGRWNPQSIAHEANRYGKLNKLNLAYRMYAGERFSDARPIGPIWYLRRDDRSELVLQQDVNPEDW